MKSDVGRLALFGGEPLFSRPRPIGQLDTPDVGEVLSLVRGAFDARHLTNDGRLVRTLEERLAEYHGVRHCVAVANAALGLMMLLQLFSRDRKGRVIMPGFSFRGLPHFARWAGQDPLFCDVDHETHGLDTAAVDAAIDDRTTAILAVCNAHHPGDLDGLCRVAAKHGVPLVLDSVYAMGASHNGRRLGGFGSAEVYSLHATKLVNGFEGGYVTTDDDGLADLLRWQRNFALPGLRPDVDGADASVLGANAKLNEMHAAMALCSLARVDAIIAENRVRDAAYRMACADLAGLWVHPYAGAPRDGRNYSMPVLGVGGDFPLTRDQLLALLRAEGCAIGPYYSPPLHHANTAGASHPSLRVVESLAGRFLQLPAGGLVDRDDVARVGELLAFISHHGADIADRLAAAPERRQ